MCPIFPELHPCNNPFSTRDTSSLPLLAVLSVLDLSHCSLPLRSLLPIGESQTLRVSLRQLHASKNTFGLPDTTALALLPILKVLNLTSCRLPPGSLVPIGESKTLQESLRQLHADRNTFGLPDTTALALLYTLQTLNLESCNLPPGSLPPIYKNLVILHQLHADHNPRLSPKDQRITIAFSRFTII